MIIKTLGIGFHLPVDGVHFLTQVRPLPLRLHEFRIPDSKGPNRHSTIPISLHEKKTQYDSKYILTVPADQKTVAHKCAINNVLHSGEKTKTKNLKLC